MRATIPVIVFALALVGCADLLGIGPTEEVVVWEDDSFDDLRDGPLAGWNGWSTGSCSLGVRSGALQLTPTGGELCEADKNVPVQTGGRQRLTAQVRISRFAIERGDDTLARVRIRTEPVVEDKKTLQLYVGRSIRASYGAGDEVVQPMLVRATQLETHYELSVDIDLATGDVAVSVDDVEAATFHVDATAITGLTLTGWNLGGEVYIEDLRGIGGL